MNAEGFWERVDCSGDCWLWTGSCTKAGYGQVYVGNGKKVYAHRFCWELVIGPIPEGRGLDHHVECPKNCVRPGHTRPATSKQNQENRVNRTRSASGVRGVFANNGSWMARVRHNGKDHYAGNFATLRCQ